MADEHDDVEAEEVDPTPNRPRPIVPGIDIETQLRGHVRDLDAEIGALDIEHHALQDRYRKATAMTMALVIGLARGAEVPSEAGKVRMRQVSESTFEVAIDKDLFARALDGFDHDNMTALLHDYDDRVVFQVRPMQSLADVKRKERE